MTINNCDYKRRYYIEHKEVTPTKYRLYLNKNLLCLRCSSIDALDCHYHKTLTEKFKRIKAESRRIYELNDIGLVIRTET